MSSISTAISLDRRSRVSGYKINKLFQENTINLPQVIAIFAEANTANQAGITTTKKELTSAKEAGDTYGYGSPIHQIMRILRPTSGDGVAGIPTVVFPQLEAGGATAGEVEITVTGTATSNTTHTIVVGGRGSLDFQSYSFGVVSGDTATVIAAKIADAVNGVLGSPFSAASALGVVTLTTKWAGESAVVKARISTGDNLAGLVYAETSNTAGTGVADIAPAFAQFGDDWYTIVINSHGESKLADMEAFNGKPDPTAPTGRFKGDVFKPFVALFGSTLSSRTALEAITNAPARVNEQTNVLCPAPNSEAQAWEAAANVALTYARIAQDTPHLDANNQFYLDMPVPEDGVIGDMAEYNNRDLLVKKGCSTVILSQGAYRIQDLVTTYHPDGEVPLQYAYVRNLTVDFNVAFGYKALEEINVKDHTLVLDNQISEAAKTVKPREWKAVLFDYFDDLGLRALFKDVQFSKDSLLVQISPTNPDRFETFFRYKRTGIARIESTDVEAGF